MTLKEKKAQPRTPKSPQPSLDRFPKLATTADTEAGENPFEGTCLPFCIPASDDAGDKTEPERANHDER
jgi:hypothetical protein